MLQLCKYHYNSSSATVNRFEGKIYRVKHMDQVNVAIVIIPPDFETHFYACFYASLFLSFFFFNFLVAISR
uniref:Uncharacterized protein LOC105122612 isoform X1 n=1 Tax=Rhizophora mucronata TaxID=61149 RepID=A0A2P2LA77_RHIMU